MNICGIRAVTLLGLCLALSSCDTRQTVQYQGGLLFGQGAYLMRYSLSNGNLSVVGHLGDSIIREISPLRDTHLLIAESAWTNERRQSRISWFSLETSESVDLYSGVHARYLPTGNVIVYDDGSDLYAVPQKPDSDNEVIVSHGKNQLSSMLGIPGGLLLFELSRDGQSLIRSWNAETGEVRDRTGLTATCRLQGAVWIAPLQRLACKQRGGAVSEAEYVLADLEGELEGALALPSDNTFRALTYIDSQDALIFQETREALVGDRPSYTVWALDINTGESQRLPGNVNLGDSAVYAPF